MSPSYNLKNSAVKRILQEAKELGQEQSTEYEAHPLEDNIFEWHFTVVGPKDTEFDGGRYHGRILLPAEYPFKPPHLIFLTPNGRFELNTKVCLSITDHHPEFWQPAWGIRTVLLAVIGFFPTTAQGAIGGLDYSKEERQKLAKQSKVWKCTVCQVNNGDFITESTDIPAVHPTPLPSFTFTAVPTEEMTSGPSTSSANKHQPAADKHHQSAADKHQAAVNDTLSPATTTVQESRSAASSPPAWLDALIGLCVTLLLYVLYHKYYM